MERSIDSSNSTLTAGFFVSGGSIYLAGEEETFDDFRLQRMFELGRVEVIVFNGVPRSVNLAHLSKPESHEVHSIWISIGMLEEKPFRYISFVSSPSGSRKERMLILVGEGDELGFYTRTVTWTGTLNLTII